MALINPVLFGGSAPTTGDYLVRFIDFDGTILKEQWVNAGQAATAPTPPTHQYLTFDEWNNAFTNIQHDLDVGATYYTTDGKTYLFMRFTNTTGLQPAILLNKADTQQMNIDWGDGTGASLSGSGNITITKAAPYAAIGDYTITIECAGNWSFYTYIFGNSADYNSCLIKIFLSNTVISIGTYVFYSLHNLSSVIISNSVMSIGAWAFTYCRSLQCLIISNSVTSIGAFSINSCTMLRYIIISGGVTQIYEYAFAHCYSLPSIVIPNSVITFGTYMFGMGYSNRKIVLTNLLQSVYQYTFYTCNSLPSIVIPNSVKTIDLNAFYSCFSLFSIVIPYGVTSIGNSAFANCYVLSKYVMLPTNPPTLYNGDVFYPINKTCKFYVPDASVSAYQAATNWVTLASYIYPISELAEYSGTIFFQCNGGNAIKQIKGTVGAVATEPTAPTKTGFTFAGWYKEAALTNAWNWASDVYPATNITLYAKWV